MQINLPSWWIIALKFATLYLHILYINLFNGIKKKLFNNFPSLAAKRNILKEKKKKITALMEHEATISINNKKTFKQQETFLVNKFNYTWKTCSIKIFFTLLLLLKNTHYHLSLCVMLLLFILEEKYVSLRCTTRENERSIL